MLIITSPSQGTIVIPFTLKTSEKYDSNVPTYARDNTQAGTRDLVNSGAVIQQPTLDIEGMIVNNTGGLFQDYDVEQIRQQLINIHNASELISIAIGQSNTISLFANNPILFQNVVIKSFDIDADSETGDSYKLTMTVQQQILVNAIYNPSITTAAANTAGSANGIQHAASTDIQKKSLSPIDQGIANVKAQITANEAFGFQNLFKDTEALF